MAEQLSDDMSDLLSRVDERQRQMKEEDLPEIKQELQNNNEHLNELNGKVADHADILSPLTKEDTSNLNKILSAINTIKYIMFLLIGLWLVSQIEPVVNFIKDIEVLAWVIKFI